MNLRRSISFPAFSLTFLIFAAISALAAPTPLVNHGDSWRYRKGTSAPQANWQALADAALDGTWLTGAGGFGYGDAAIVGEATALSDMRNLYTTVYIRRTFTNSSAVETNLHLQLLVDYDDGFVAYLDGTELTRLNAPGTAGTPVANNAAAPSLHEASCCNSPVNPATTLDLGAVGNRLGVGAHILAIQGLNESSGSSDFHLIADLSLVSNSTPAGSVSGPVTVDTTWYRTNSPIVVVGNVTVNSGVTLTIEPGATVLFNQGLSLTVNGRLLAEGNENNRIRFARNTGVTSWSRIDFTASPTESRIAYADIDGAASAGNVRAVDTAIYLDHVVFTNTVQQLVTMDDASCIIQNCHFPSIQNNELLHFLRMPPNGHALIASNLFGTPGIPATTGYNDIIDFTGGNRPGPIVQFLGNIFLSAVDDCFDMDGTDAHIEGNIFMNVRQDAARDSTSNPISTGEDNFGAGDTSQLVICRNIMYNCEHMVLIKDLGSAVVQNNTVLRLTPNPLAELPPAIINFGEPHRGVPGGAGAIFEGNIVWDLQAAPFIDFTNGVMFLNVSYSNIQGTNFPGPANISSDPIFVSPSNLTYLNIASNLSLGAGSPSIGTGPNGLDMGALVPGGATISGEPLSPTASSSATLHVAGPGIFAYRWKLNDGPWSGEVPLTTNILFRANMFSNAAPITLNGLSNGAYTVYVVGKNSAGIWQSTNNPTASKSWTVQMGPPPMLTPSRNGNLFRMTFVATAGTTYSVLYKTELDPAVPWTKLKDVDAQPVTGPVQVLEPIVFQKRFYQLVTPAQP